MAVKTMFGFDDPDSAVCTMRITMTLKEWKIVRAALDANTADPIYYLKRAINQVVEKAEREFLSYESGVIMELHANPQRD